MLKKFYAAAWILLFLAVFVSLVTGAANWVALVIFSFLALALVYAHALWTLVVNNRGRKTG
jgi:hypothetical protein